MALLRQLLLLPLLAPLLAVLLVGAVNPRPAVRLQVLVWRTPALPIGVWMVLAGAGGGLLSAGATTLALRGTAAPLRRQVRRPLETGWQPPAAERPAPEDRTTEGRAATRPAWDAEPPATSAGPSRAPGEPPPTVAVPYRVIRRSASTAAPGAPTPPVPGSAPATASATATAASSASVASGADASWDSAADQDW